MTEKPRAVGPDTTGSAPGGSAPDGTAEGRADRRVVIRDKRKIDPTGGKGGPAEPAGGAKEAPAVPPAGADALAAAEPVGPEVAAAAEPASGAEARDAAADAAAAAGEAVEAVEATAERPAGVGPEATPLLDELVDDAEVEVEVGDGKARVPKLDQPEGVEGPVVDAPAEPADGVPAGPLGAELEALRAALDERTRDLQRVSAEYANYRKRVERDRGLVAEQTTGTVLAALLPVLDDLDRAREHGDLVGPFGTVAEQLTGAVGKFGLTPFGEKGDPFDPTRHEAVAHLTSADVTEPTCVEVMRRGYLLGDRLLRPALVAVADPE
jgi:molecular chaperone GrpE